ncbi:MAG: TetR/AcrR family transcriptional regulator [Candidatus Lokiarchaeota archaeon]|nr:TetR/AcrR family transcriptional regulator [Candidatus Lokiarchaeota archaeon]
MEEKKTKARTEEEKAEQYERILDAGKELFISGGGFSMRALARKLGMSEAFVYNYISSKRELWIGIRKRYFTQYQEGLQNLIDTNEGASVVDLFIAWVRFFLEFAAADYNRFKMMFLVNAPRSNKVGPLEKNYKRFNLFETGIQQIKDVLKKNNLSLSNVEKTMYFLFSVVFGTAKIEADIRLRYDITEPLSPSLSAINQEELRKYTISKVREFIESDIKANNPDY